MYGGGQKRDTVGVYSHLQQIVEALLDNDVGDGSWLNLIHNALRFGTNDPNKTASPVNAYVDRKKHNGTTGLSRAWTSTFS